ncbi:hypothetical protein B0G71_2573 [Paraburkholderia sp. BL27I4N3]|uniref:hypothetical protein n=1 Tax=Paraburkholderia sp. BL27I4N3 TaxID=1938805 RepID=UPI000E255DDD|nr:hypothetical protein [Paraburkholderia sp. BL27I4N3]REE19476.1 hypothetical protein B0G71_2573 [Paraburkholderia sp. BL27I4N3]
MQPTNTLYKNGLCFAELIRSTSQRDSVDDWAVYEVDARWRRMSKPLKVNGHTVTRYKSVTVKSYVHLPTGEVIPASAAATHGISIAGDVGEKACRRINILAELRPEVRAFAQFCLKFLNKRRGVTPGFEKLCHWYALLTGKQAKNVRRMLPKLREVGIMAGESLAGPDWQVAGKNTTAADHLNEDDTALATFGEMLMNNGAATTLTCQQLLAEITGRLPSTPHWAEVMDAEYEMYLASGGKPDRVHPEPITAANITPTQETALLRAMAFLTAHQQVLHGAHLTAGQQ